jgi:hypothetical protein
MLNLVGQSLISQDERMATREASSEDLWMLQVGHSISLTPSRTSCIRRRKAMLELAEPALWQLEAALQEVLS